MSNPYFKFKQFTVYHDLSAMKVNTDSVLLGSWTDTKDAKSILDIGTGSGILALMLAQRSEAMIDAIDIDKDAYLQASQNSEQSKWKDRITLYHQSLQQFSNLIDKKYDLIISNPPYFVNNTKTPTLSRTIARHSDLLSFEDLLSCSKKLLSNTGKLNIVLPTRESQVLIDLLPEYDFYIQRLTKIRPNQDKEFTRNLICLGFDDKDMIEDELYIETSERHVYSEAYKLLTKEFYLNF